MNAEKRLLLAEGGVDNENEGDHEWKMEGIQRDVLGPQ